MSANMRKLYPPRLWWDNLSSHSAGPSLEQRAMWGLRCGAERHRCHASARDSPPSHSPALSPGGRWRPGSSHPWQPRLLGWCTAAHPSSCTGKRWWIHSKPLAPNASRPPPNPHPPQPTSFGNRPLRGKVLVVGVWWRVMRLSGV